LGLLGCQSGQEIGTLSAGAGDEESTSDDGEEDGEESGDAGDGDGDGEDEGLPKLDVGDGDGDGDTGCEKVDFLFVIDNSISMADNQDELIGSFPGFIQSIQETLNATDDYHIMVVDTDAETRCTPAGCADDQDQWAQCLCPGLSNGEACIHEYTQCDLTMGAGVIDPRGSNASNKLCDVPDGQRYLDASAPDLSNSFSCMARVGEAGHQAERPMDAMLAALSDDLNGDGGCNEGFLRSDAILVVTFISDDGSIEDTGTPQEWHDAVVSAKGGDESAVVVLGLVPEWPACASGGAMGCMIAGLPEDNPNQGQHWIEFVESWGDYGLWAHVCEANYSPFFQQAVDLVDQVCDAFEPPG
jgi:hypothetical protein